MDPNEEVMYVPMMKKHKDLVTSITCYKSFTTNSVKKKV